MTGLKTAMAAPYLFRRSEVYYLRLRARGSVSGSLTISLRTFDKAIATAITADMLKHLKAYHFENPSVTWVQLKAHLYGVTQDCLLRAYGDLSAAAYGVGHVKPRDSTAVANVLVEKDLYITPQGIAEPGCALQAPDYGNPNEGFGNPRGVYLVHLTIPSRDARPLIKQIVEAHEANYKALVARFRQDRSALMAQLSNGRKLLGPYEGGMPFFENEDHSVTFKFKAYASYPDKDTLQPQALPLDVVDSRGRRIDKVPAIAGGSVLKVRFSIFPYGWTNVAGASVKLNLDSVMLIKLVESRTVDGWQGEEVEGGYEVVTP